ncbi:MAG: hypothetical protein ACKVPX_00160 [Myxococcaceae bacterium]
MTTSDQPSFEDPLGVIRRFLQRVWREEALLAAASAFLGFLAVLSAFGVWLDPRVITGAPAWLKPFKFAVSTSVYSLTLAWVLTWLPSHLRLRRVVRVMTVVVLLLEVGIIDVQAARGTTSHFNMNTPLDAVLFSIMGVAIFTQTFTTVAVAVALWRQNFADTAMGWALRFGMTITIAGALTGGLMSRPTEAQLAELRAGRPLVAAGAHTVGAPDGGPGLPITGWSTRHGDLRVPHFVGLHAIQLLPLFTWLTGALARRDRQTWRTPLTIGAASMYALGFVALLAQALLGLPVVGGS